MFFNDFYRYGVIIMHKNQYGFSPILAPLASILLMAVSSLAFGSTVQLQPKLETTPDPYFSMDETSHQKQEANRQSPQAIMWGNTTPPAVQPPTQSKYPQTKFLPFNPKGPLTTGQVSPDKLPANTLKLENKPPLNSIIREQKDFVAPLRKPSTDRESGFRPMVPKKSPPINELKSDPPSKKSRRYEGLQTGLTTEIQSEPEVLSFEPSQVLALVGGYPIFVGDLLFEVNQMIEQFMPQAPAPMKERERKKLISKMLPKYVEAKILYAGVVQSLPKEADFGAVLAQAEEQFDKSALPEMLKNSGLNSQNELDANLRAMGSSLRQHRESWAEDQITKFFLGQQLRASNEITHQEMLKVYRDNLKDYEKPAKCIWEQILIRFDRSKSREDARKSIVTLGNDIVFGGNFSAVAKKSSHGYQASKGGRYDWTNEGALVSKEINDFIFSAPIGDLSDIIETQNGFHIVRVVERTDATRTPFLEAQIEIKKQIKASRQSDAFQEHFAKLKKSIPVEYFINKPLKPIPWK